MPPKDWTSSVWAQLENQGSPVPIFPAKMVWVVESHTEDNVFYYVLEFDYNGERLFVCTCPGFRYRNHCKHIEEVQFVRQNA